MIYFLHYKNIGYFKLNNYSRSNTKYTENTAGSPQGRFNPLRNVIKGIRKVLLSHRRSNLFPKVQGLRS